MNATPTRLEVTFPLVRQGGLLTFRGLSGKATPFTPTRVKAVAGVHPGDGHVMVEVRAFDGRGMNASLWTSWEGQDFPTVPGWCPSLPTWFRDTVAAMGYTGTLPVPRDTNPQGENPA